MVRLSSRISCVVIGVLVATLSLVTGEEALNTTLAPPTTAAVPTTSEAPTTVEPSPPVGRWNITEGNLTCIRAELSLVLEIPYEGSTRNLTLEPTAKSVGSSCNFSDGMQSLVLADSDFILTFIFEKRSGDVSVANVTLEYTPEPGVFESFYNDDELFHMTEGHAYLCHTKIVRSLGNATMTIDYLRMYAFGTASDTDFPKAEECFDDLTYGDLLPIVMACALAGCIVIVLVIYLIGHRRSRQAGYLSV